MANRAANSRRIKHAVTGEEMSSKCSNLDVERDRFPFSDDHFDVAAVLRTD